MNVLWGFLAGIGVGLAFFGSLWWTVRRTVATARDAGGGMAARGEAELRNGRSQAELGNERRDDVAGGLAALSRLARFSLAGATFYVLSCTGAASLLAGLFGFWLARWFSIFMAEVAHAR